MTTTEKQLQLHYTKMDYTDQGRTIQTTHCKTDSKTNEEGEGCVQVSVCVWWRLKIPSKIPSSITLHLIFWERYLTQSGAHWCHYTNWTACPDIPLPLFPSNAITETSHHACIFMWVLGIQAQSSWLHGKNCAERTISLALTLALNSSLIKKEF